MNEMMHAMHCNLQEAMSPLDDSWQIGKMNRPI